MQVNFALSELLASNFAKPKWRHNKMYGEELLCAANDIDWAPVSQITRVNDKWYHIKKTYFDFKTISSLPVPCHEEEPFRGLERNTNVPNKVNNNVFQLHVQPIGLQCVC